MFRAPSAIGWCDDNTWAALGLARRELFEIALNMVGFGQGVASSNLAGRTLADLIGGVDSEAARLPWVGHRSPDWEPEPLRWLGVHAVASLAHARHWIDERRH